jgi:hypothetical protein
VFIAEVLDGTSRLIWSTVIKARKRHLLCCCVAADLPKRYPKYSGRIRETAKLFILATKTLSHEAQFQISTSNVQRPIRTPPVFDHLPLTGEEFIAEVLGGTSRVKDFLFGVQ